MKILHVLDHTIPLHSGYSFRTLSILREQRARGWQTAHLTGPKHNVAKSLKEDIDGWMFYRSPPPPGLSGHVPGLREAAIVLAMARRITEVAEIERPDILHAHSPALDGLAAVKAGRKLGLPVVYEVRAFWEDAAVDLGTATKDGIRYRLTRGMESSVLRRCHAITTICEGLRGEIVARGISPGKVTVIPNAVDPQEFDFHQETDAEFRQQHGLDGKIVIGFIGSWYAYEGLDLLLRALPPVLRARPDVAVLLVGGGPAEQKLRDLAHELGLDSIVRFVGRVPHDEVGRYYDLVDFLVYPRHSMRLTELVTPLKPLEAMARGRIVLASNVGGHRELVLNGETGFLFGADDTTGLAEAIFRVLAAREHWPRIQKAARDFIEKERSWQHSVARYTDVYDRLLQTRRTQAA